MRRKNAAHGASRGKPEANVSAPNGAKETPADPMKLHINGEERSFDSPSPFTLSALVELLNMKPDRVAVELNREIVPRDRWSETLLNDADHLEVVHFVGGGCASSADQGELQIAFSCDSTIVSFCTPATDV